MPTPDFTLEFVKDAAGLQRLSNILVSLSCFALDIETVDWWNRQRERIALVQIAFRTRQQIKVAVIDALAKDFKPEFLRSSLENASVIKIIHNAAFDAVRLEKHYGFHTVSIFDTMAAARRSGERKYSLKAQADIYLNLRLDKSERTSDWSRRPLEPSQLYYAALDPYAAFLLYENQAGRKLTGDYRLRPSVDSIQNPLPLPLPSDKSSPPVKSKKPAPVPLIETEPQFEPAFSTEPAFEFESAPRLELSDLAAALLGIIAELPTRYYPEALAASVGGERAGLTGWIIDRRLGVDFEPDEEAVKLAIIDLCENGLIRITVTRRLEATAAGAETWQRIKS